MGGAKDVVRYILIELYSATLGAIFIVYIDKIINKECISPFVGIIALLFLVSFVVFLILNIFTDCQIFNLVISHMPIIMVSGLFVSLLEKIERRIKIKNSHKKE